jgi:hypothetical protein
MAVAIEDFPMKRIYVLTIIFTLCAVGQGLAQQPKVPMDRRGLHCDRCCCECAEYSWSGAFYDTTFGVPVALVIPPTAELQTHLGWGVGGSRITTNCIQFNRIYPGGGSYNRRAFLPTPPWPSDTDQFGVYYVRGPWH